MNILAQLGQLGASLPMPEFAQEVPTVDVPAFDPGAVNVMQQAAAPPPPPPPSQPPQAPKMNAEAPRKRRRSLLDTIGGIADVLAKVGGAEALYQPTLDAREDRALGMEDRQRKIQADEIALATGKFALGGEQNERIGQVAKGVKALTRNGGDPAQAWAALASQMQLDPATIESFGQVIAADPNALDGIIAATTDPKFDQAKYGGSVVYGTDAQGNLVAYQPGLGNEGGRSVLPEGITPIDPPKFVDTGGSQTGYGSRSGEITRILPKTEKPGYRGGQPIRERPGYRGGRPIAPPPAKDGKTGEAGDPSGALANLQELRGVYESLREMGAMVSPEQASDKNFVARLRASGPGQLLEGAVGTKAQTQRDRVASIRPALMQSLAKATGMTGKQLDSNADVKLFMQTVTDPTTSYEANIAAINGLERFLKNNTKSAPAASPKTPVKPKAASGWKIVGVK